MMFASKVITKPVAATNWYEFISRGSYILDNFM